MYYIYIYIYIYVNKHTHVCVRGGTWWRSWLKHCTTSRKIAVSIPDGVTEIYQ